MWWFILIWLMKYPGVDADWLWKSAVNCFWTWATSPQCSMKGTGEVCAVTHCRDVRLVMQLQTHLSLIVWQAQNVQLWCSFKLQLVRPNLPSSSMLHVLNERKMQDSVLKNLRGFCSLHTSVRCRLYFWGKDIINGVTHVMLSLLEADSSVLHKGTHLVL